MTTPPVRLLSLKQRVLASRLSRLTLLPTKLRALLSHASWASEHRLGWLVRPGQHTNFSYDLDPLNQACLPAFVATITETTNTAVEECFGELLANVELRDYIPRATASSPHPYVTDPMPRYGRRLSWHASIQIKKPKVVVETGVDTGVGIYVSAAALERNAAQSHIGRGYSTDTNPEAGFLVRDEYAKHCTILYRDSLRSLSDLPGRVAVFINDSDHSADCEAAEYAALRDTLAHGALVVGDSAHVTERRLHFAQETGRRFLYFHERPRDHCCPGAGIGLAFDQVRED